MYFNNVVLIFNIFSNWYLNILFFRNEGLVFLDFAIPFEFFLSGDKINFLTDSGTYETRNGLHHDLPVINEKGLIKATKIKINVISHETDLTLCLLVWPCSKYVFSPQTARCCLLGHFQNPAVNNLHSVTFCWVFQVQI